MIRKFRRLLELLRDGKNNPSLVKAIPVLASAQKFSRNYREQTILDREISQPDNPLWDYFMDRFEGSGIWKWEHYFSIYQRHFSKFVGSDVNVLEIGIYSGGSLGLWRSYFGDRCTIYGVDIEDACKIYENEYTKVFVGDQEDREFWKSFRDRTEGVDILIDDGGHSPEQQRVTLEEMLPYLRPGGVYLCEDIHHRNNEFAAYATQLVDELNQFKGVPGESLKSENSPFQQSIHSIHFYPFALVIEKHSQTQTHLSAPKHGTEWQPFL